MTMAPVSLPDVRAFLTNSSMDADRQHYLCSTTVSSTGANMLCTAYPFQCYSQAEHGPYLSNHIVSNRTTS